MAFSNKNYRLSVEGMPGTKWHRKAKRIKMSDRGKQISRGHDA